MAKCFFLIRRWDYLDAKRSEDGADNAVVAGKEEEAN